MKRNNYKLSTTFTLLLLFFSHWMYYHAETGITSTDFFIVAEFCIFFVFYEMAVLRLSPLWQVMWVILCVLPLSYYYYRMQFEYQSDYFIPMTYLSVFLFYTSQYIFLITKKYELLSSILLILLHIFPVIYLGVIIYMVSVKRNSWETFFSAGVNYSTIIFLLIFILYLVIFVLGNSSVKKRKQKDHKEILYRDSILFALVTIIETMILARFYTATTIKHTVPLLWILNLSILYYQGNPHICKFVARMRSKIDTFLSLTD